MSVVGDYLGMRLEISDLDKENLAYFCHCAAGDYQLQGCKECDLLRYPTTTACPWCSSLEASWVSVEGRGVVYSYSEVQHAIHPAFAERLPYLILLVELDTQRGRPSPGEALRLTGNLVTPDGDLAPPDVVATVGIGTRVRMVFKNVAKGLAIPLWTIDEEAEQPSAPWRYPEE